MLKQYTLILNTIYANINFAIIDNNSQHIIECSNVNFRGEDLIYTLNQMLGDYKISINEINAIAVVRGPGSFTGIRVGIACANMLANVLNIPIYGGTFFEIMNHYILNNYSNKGDYILALPVNHSGCYVQLYHADSSVSQPAKGLLTQKEGDEYSLDINPVTLYGDDKEILTNSTSIQKRYNIKISTAMIYEWVKSLKKQDCTKLVKAYYILEPKIHNKKKESSCA